MKFEKTTEVYSERCILWKRKLSSWDHKNVETNKLSLSLRLEMEICEVIQVWNIEDD